MIDQLDVLALIPARGGSKGFPGKNVARLGDKSLIGWAVTAANASRYVDRVVISTDSAEIAAEGRSFGAEVPFLRPDELATDEAASDAVVLHALRTLGFTKGLLVLLQPTSPLRTAADIDACLELAAASEVQASVSVTEVDKSPYWMFQIDGGGRLSPLISETARPKRRQDAPAVYVLNGAVYVVRAERFLMSQCFEIDHVPAHIMPRERSIDIDCKEDLELAQRYWAQSKAGSSN